MRFGDGGIDHPLCLPPLVGMLIGGVDLVIIILLCGLRFVMNGSTCFLGIDCLCQVSWLFGLRLKAYHCA